MMGEGNEKLGNYWQVFLYLLTLFPQKIFNFPLKVYFFLNVYFPNSDFKKGKELELFQDNIYS